jgi:hypothetical protein
VEVKYTLVYGTGNNDDICDFGNTCDLGVSGSGAISVNGPLDMSPAPNQTRYAVGLRVRLQNTFLQGKPDCSRDNYGGDCEFYFRGSVRTDSEPPGFNNLLFNDPVQRIFRGNSLTSGSIRWLRVKADRNPCPSTPLDETSSPPSGLEGSVPLGAPSCFVVEMALKGGLAGDSHDRPFLFNDGVGASQMGFVDCTDPGTQPIVEEIMNGCPPLYGPHSFNYTPLCPAANALFTKPNPGSPWDVDWPPIRCVKTRPTSQGTDLIKGLNGRIFFPNDPNPSPNPPNTCPPQNGPGYTQGRNYWQHDGMTNPDYGYFDAHQSPVWQTHFDPQDDRLVTIFVTTPESFAGSGQNTYPINGAIGVYITGFGRIQGNGSLQVDDPCAEPLQPSDIDLSGGSAGGRVVWGHFVNLTVLSAGATSSGVACNPGASSQPCVPVLVE